ncbi:linoleate diol synthase [Dacryopinax primogenitus]|uniref:Linoleate diol synthase n=1 Tax=Dacryopinax primogenitus (strain DJM 731) TaxID=1858805 RepID=M5G5C3_DACPD|nr:linoleate diol synthase [Dacryopinax primogenitus]EJU01027.1 linoleate diol synthase [Dacryopinax primogenitus]
MSGILNAISRASNLISASLAPVDTDGGSLKAPPGILARGISEIEGLVRSGSAVGPSDLPALLDAIQNLNGPGIDDRLFLLEKLLVLMSRMPADSAINQKMQAFFIDTLYKDLPHPPSAYLAPAPLISPDPHPKRAYNYRSTNGDNYSQAIPLLGRAGMPYSRTVPSASCVPPSSLPDPGLVFDLLLSRPAGKFKPHPGGLSSLFFGMANLVIHSIFDTNRTDWNINDTSSYIDLSPLYGNGVSKMKAPPEALRRFDGTGRLHEDVFGDARLLFMPPTTAVLLVLLCRNHNYIAEKILSINENGTYLNPPPHDETARRAQDDEIFERTRLVNSGFFARVVLYDYVGGILGMTRDGSAFRLNLDQQIRRSDHEIAPLGEGNQISAEFNLLYRWHASTSAPDKEWIDDTFKTILQGKPYNQVTVEDFTTAAGKFMRPNDPDPKKWEFGGLKRDPVTLRFDDAALAKILKDATEAPAHAFGARQTPEALRVVEIMTILQGRSWAVCTLNEFRSFFGLKPYANFKEWNPNPEIYNAAQALYGHIDRLELHVGLQAEEAKGAMPGAGLCPSYTVSRAILADAVVLCRADPYLSSEFTPYNCTAWGYQDCAMNPNDGSFGGALTKLMLRHLPGQYKTADAYVHFPFLVPNEVRRTMELRKDPMVHKYDWKRPVAQTTVPAGTGIKTLNLITLPAQNDRITKLIGKGKINRALVNQQLLAYLSQPKTDDIFAEITKKLIDENSVLRPGFSSKQVDIVQTVINMVPVYFVANYILGLPLKTTANPHGVYRPEELYAMFANAADYILYDQDAPDQWCMCDNATGCADMMRKEISANLDRLAYGVWSITGLVDTVADMWASKTNQSDTFLSTLLSAGKKTGMTVPDISASLFAVVIPSVPQFSAVVTQLLDFWLSKDQTSKKTDLAQMAAAGPGMNPQIAAYAKQAIKSIPALTPTDASAINGSMAVANPLNSIEGLMSEKIFDKTAPVVLRSIFSLRNVRRAPGQSGFLPMFTQTVLDQPQTFFINNESGLSPWPTRLMIQYDA